MKSNSYSFSEKVLLRRIDTVLVALTILVATFTLGLSNAYAAHGDPAGGGSGFPKNDFVIPMNYELGMHCTGFEFAYCCVLPPYNSILAQVIKTEGVAGINQPIILDGDPNVGKDAVLLRETVVRDPELDSDNNFKKYVLRYRHEAQPRNDGNGKAQGDPLISAVELNSMFMWNTVYDRTAKEGDGTLQTGSYNNALKVPTGDGVYDVNDNYGSGWMNHFYIYVDPDTGHPNVEGKGATGVDTDKIYLGIDVPIPVDCGPSLQPMGPVTTDPNDPSSTVPNDCGGAANGNVLTFSTDDGTVVYTKMKVLDDLPVMLTSPRLWEALGLPLTPFEDTIAFFGNPANGDGPGSVDEDSIRPYVKMIAEMEHYDTGFPVIDSNGNPVVAFGTAPIDIPNCERCHSELDPNSFNSAQNAARNPGVAALVEEEYDFWLAYYDVDPNLESDWYARLKGAAISMLAIHDNEHGTEFTQFFPGVECMDPNNCVLGPLTAPVLGSVGDMLDAGDPRLAMPQNTRLGHESVICQKCHADNVIAVVQSAECGPGSVSCGSGDLIPPVTQAIHDNHQNVSEGGDISFTDSLGRDGGCQGCHPAHRSDGDMAGYPITIDGDNFYQDSDNRLASGGCFVGRDVHSNIYKDTDGANTDEYLNSVGLWLSENVFDNQAGEPGGNQDTRGIWCTNCHTQLSQELWRAENVYDLVNNLGVCVDAGGVNEGVTCKSDSDCGGGETCALNNIRNASLQGIADEVAGGDLDLVLSWLDPKGSICEGATDPDLNGRNCNVDADCGDGLCMNKSIDGTDHTHRIWDKTVEDANVATLEVNLDGNCNVVPWTIAAPGGPCVELDGETDVNVRILDFCTTPDCVAAAQTLLDGEGNNSIAFAVPFAAATDGREHWLSPGEPHCADCHRAPYTEQSGNINPFPPFNYPRKASLMRYSRGHQDITCQGCHESIHGLYPVTPNIDTTSYAQAAQWNNDDSHGPLKCGACHHTNSQGVNGAAKVVYTDPVTGDQTPVEHDFEAAVSWMHTYTDEADPRAEGSICSRCHEVDDARLDVLDSTNKKWTQHADAGRISRKTMDKAERRTYAEQGAQGPCPDVEGGCVSGDPDPDNDEIYVQGFPCGNNSCGDPAEPGENPYETVCVSCHKDRSRKVTCDNKAKWKNHLVDGRAAHKVFEIVSVDKTGTTCGW